MKTIGGQAVIEGVLMRDKENYSIAVRKDNKIKTIRKKIKQPNRFWKIPFLRGIYALFETIVIGIKSLNYSAQQQEEKEEELKTWHLILSLVLSVIFALIIFKLIPLTIAQLFSGLNNLFQNNIIFNLIEGLFKILIFVLYVYLIGLFKDVRRLFQYHGAEHKTVHCYEAGKPLTIDNVKKYSVLHARCGTSFIMIVILISIFVYSFIPNIEFVWKYIYRILLLPVIAGISYEILKLSGKYQENTFWKLLSKPGLFIQKLTTAEPDNKQIEVAVKALKAVI